MHIQTTHSKQIKAAAICACAILYCTGSATANMIQLKVPEKHASDKPRTRMFVGDRIEIQYHGPVEPPPPPPAYDIWVWDSAVECGSTRIGFSNQAKASNSRQQYVYPRYDRARKMWLPINCEVKRAGRSSGMSVQWHATKNRNVGWSVLTISNRTGVLVGERTFAAEKAYVNGPVKREPDIVTVTYANSLRFGTETAKAAGLITVAGATPWKVAATIQCSGEACAFLTIDGVGGRHGLKNGWHGIISQLANAITIEAAGTPPGQPRTGEINVALEIL